MKAPLAAAYLGISKTKFLEGVGCKRYPKPFYDGKNALWILDELNNLIDRDLGVGASSAEGAIRKSINEALSREIPEI
ncbi:MAG: hypothetical protein J3T61_00110 [Candidatus Brocadiales bacterium]|nr:hypothetical protein [Candidatus Bathyanammoxibius sp.]